MGQFENFEAGDSEENVVPQELLDEIAGAIGAGSGISAEDLKKQLENIDDAGRENLANLSPEADNALSALESVEGETNTAENFEDNEELSEHIKEEVSRLAPELGMASNADPQTVKEYWQEYASSDDKGGIEDSGEFSPETIDWLDS